MRVFSVGLFNFPGVGEVSDTAHTPPPAPFLKGQCPYLCSFSSHYSPFPLTLPSQGAWGDELFLLHPGFGLEKDFTVVSCDH